MKRKNDRGLHISSKTLALPAGGPLNSKRPSKFIPALMPFTVQSALYYIKPRNTRLCRAPPFLRARAPSASPSSSLFQPFAHQKHPYFRKSGKRKCGSPFLTDLSNPGYFSYRLPTWIIVCSRPYVKHAVTEGRVFTLTRRPREPRLPVLLRGS